MTTYAPGRDDVAIRNPAKRRVASYMDAVRWIAFNDDCDLGTPDTGFIISICLVADLWREGDQVQVAADVVRVREANA